MLPAGGCSARVQACSHIRVLAHTLVSACPHVHTLEGTCTHAHRHAFTHARMHSRSYAHTKHTRSHIL